MRRTRSSPRHPCDHGDQPDVGHHRRWDGRDDHRDEPGCATAVDFGTTAGTVTADTATSITVTSPAEAAAGAR